MLLQLGRIGEEWVTERPGTDRPAARQRRWLGEHMGVGIHAGVTVAKGDARGRERLARYMARPALCLRRISYADDGRVRITFKQPWRTGRTGLLLRPEVFVLRLAGLVMPAGMNLVRYHGVFAPASPLRSRVVPEPPHDKVPASRWIRWGLLILRVFATDPRVCPRCGSAMTRMGTLQEPGRAWEVFHWIRTLGDLLPATTHPP